ncbi:putative lipoprotein [plant metagenome]|uniref:Putative lipoprotein n=1 Tax=plant metagenome TaxID=1297885 RepID=A0A484V2V9_9ZZZZ
MTRRNLAIFALAMFALGACASPPSTPSSGGTPRTEKMSADQFGQTDFNRTVTIAMRDNQAGLHSLLDKLYRRNPREWRKGGAPDFDTAVKRVRDAMAAGRPPAGLQGLRDIQILAVSLDPAYRGDRVAAFIFGLSDTIVTAHGGKTRFYVSDMLDGQRVYNAARNVEAAAWLLATRKDEAKQPLLLANEISDTAVNLSFEREFGALVGRLDLIANLLGENSRRVGINYAQGLMFFSFLPVR